jgi:integrase
LDHHQRTTAKGLTRERIEPRRNATRCRFRNLRAKLPHRKRVVSYTDALENGVGVARVAELLGHISTDMVMQHYQHLR